MREPELPRHSGVSCSSMPAPKLKVATRAFLSLLFDEVCSRQCTSLICVESDGPILLFSILHRYWFRKVDRPAAFFAID